MGASEERPELAEEVRVIDDRQWHRVCIGGVGHEWSSPVYSVLYGCMVQACHRCNGVKRASGSGKADPQRTLTIDYVGTADWMDTELHDDLVEVFERYGLKVDGTSDGPYEPVPPLKCGGCGLLYSSPGWCDVVIPDDDWLAISPTGTGGGVLCLTCMASRLVLLGRTDVPMAVTSGPFVHSDRPREDHP